MKKTGSRRAKEAATIEQVRYVVCYQNYIKIDVNSSPKDK